MKLIIYKGLFKSGKTITLRMLHSKLLNLKFSENTYLLNGRQVSDENYKFATTKFNKITKLKCEETSSRSSKDEYDFYSIIQIDNKKILLISYSTNSIQFSEAFAHIFNDKIDILVLATKLKEQSTTIYVKLESFFKTIKAENYLEILSQQVSKHNIIQENEEKSDKLLNILLKTLNGEQLSELDN